MTAVLIAGLAALGGSCYLVQSEPMARNRSLHRKVTAVMLRATVVMLGMVMLWAVGHLVVAR